MCAKSQISDRYFNSKGYELTATHFHDRPRTVGHGGMNNVRRMNDLVAVRHMKLMKLNVLSITKTAVVVVRSSTCGAPLRTT